MIVFWKNKSVLSGSKSFRRENHFGYRLSGRLFSLISLKRCLAPLKHLLKRNIRLASIRDK
ncbi:MAG: hypothetical protein YK1309IOTA_920001, partial [Marine Group I thaumarchaeote]